MNDELLELIDTHRDGGLSPEQHERLKELLTSDPTARRAFVQEQMMEAAFQLETPGIMDEAPLRRAMTPVPPQRFAGAWTWAAAAAVVLSVFGIGWRVGGALKEPTIPLAGDLEAAEPVDSGIAVVTQTVDAQWSGEVQPRTGSLLSEGKLKLLSGLVQIEFYSGARLILDGPSEVELVSANQAICHAGRLRAQVPPQARGFSITAPKFKVVDLGTEFGLEVASTGNAKVQVFDGEVELHSQEPVRHLLGGKGLSWLDSGEKSEITADPASLPSFDQVRDLTQQHSQQRHAAWRKWNASLADDPRIAARYDFESADGTLLDSGSGKAHGLILGCERTNGRWAEKGALEFKRTSDRVRVDIPGEFDSLSMTAWIRLDALQDRHQALLLTDGFEVGRPHWQIAPPGDLRLGLRSPPPGRERITESYSSETVFGPGMIGVWSFVAFVYDRQAGKVRHYINGKLASSTSLRFDQPLQIGNAEIGNWGRTLGRKTSPVRNFIGRMDELTVWKVALKGDEVQTMFRQTRP